MNKKNIPSPFIADNDIINRNTISDEERAAAMNYLSSCEHASKFIDECGKLDLVAILKEMEVLRQEELLKNHNYAITRLADGRWQTFVYDEFSYNKRKLIRRKNREDVIKYLLTYYNAREIHTLNDIAYMWLERKRIEPGFKPASFDRYENHYKRVFSDIANVDIKKLNEVKLEDYLLDFICNEKISKRVWSDLKTVIRGIFKYARRHGYTKIPIESILENIEEEKKIFVKSKTRNSSDEVFTDIEVNCIEAYIDNREQLSLVDLGIKLAFRTGLRAGELAAIKYSDLDKEGKRLNIARTEQHSKKEDGHIHYYFSDEGTLKCDHEAEYLYLTKKALSIIEQIHEMNPDHDYLFYTDHFIRSQAFTKRLNNICRIVGIKPRPLHKARKTYATRLINANVEDSLVMTQLRHSDITTTRKFYYFDNRTAYEKAEAIEKAIGQY